ncbi:hypothetical protein A0H81_00584 [Grifola frondosa]|uniref:Uncharacterized protein n=1 Tax=Grifola frondosa TaxID=5627 RepID=A0A1C7MRM7_GRIFR|nr:hypothetical protein A0H81_00584 [Grifola frondosa]
MNYLLARCPIHRFQEILSWTFMTWQLSFLTVMHAQILPFLMPSSSRSSVEMHPLKCTPHVSYPGIVTIDTFASPEGVKSSLGRDLTRRDLKTSSGVAKTLITAISLCREIICAPHQTGIAEIDIRPKEACLMINYESCPGPGLQHLSGFDPSMLWIYLVIGPAVTSEPSEDPFVALDLVTPQIGFRVEVSQSMVQVNTSSCLVACFQRSVPKLDTLLSYIILGPLACIHFLRHYL